MFHRFSAAPDRARGRKSRNAHATVRSVAATGNDRHHSSDNPHRLTWTTSELDEAETLGNAAQKIRKSTKRQKTTHACDRCRLHRVKCGELKPCVRCVDANAQCVVSRAKSSSPRDSQPLGANATAPGRHGSRERAGSNTAAERTPTLAEAQFSPHTQLHCLNISQKYSAEALPLNKPRPCQFEPSSEIPDESKYLAALASGYFPLPPCSAMPSGARIQSNRILQARQRSYYLRLFWEVCQPLFHIISDTDFRELDECSPPTDPGDHATYSVRHALIDAMIALAVQHSLATGLVSRILDVSQQTPTIASEASWPGFQHFHWCRERMRTNEDVCIDALRAHALLALYLIRGNAFRDAYNLLGITIRKAYIAKLHRPPPSQLPEGEKTARMQLWWMLFSLDIRCSLQLGSPVACQPSLIRCPQPTRDALARYISKSPTTTSIDHASLAYCIAALHLATVMANISACVSHDDLEDLSDANAIEDFSNTLDSALMGLELWQSQLPTDLLIGRSTNSADQFQLDLGSGRPLWLQRHAILLELKYHNAYVMFLRPCMRATRLATFTESDATREDCRLEQRSRLLLERHLESALSHSFAIIDIIYAVSSQSDIIYGWFEAVESLWNAALTIVAYTTSHHVAAESRRAQAGDVHDRSVLLCFSTFQCLHALSRAELILNAFSPTCPGVLASRNILSSLVGNLRAIYPCWAAPPTSNLQDVVMVEPNETRGSGEMPVWDDVLPWDLFVTLMADQALVKSLGEKQDGSWDSFADDRTQLFPDAQPSNVFASPVISAPMASVRHAAA